MRTYLAAISILAFAACETQTPSETSLADSTPSSQASEAAAQDPYLWMEEVEGEEALAWVTQQNDRSLATLEADPAY
ncbi:MAG TPA: S9 family peptidase, partial [Hyphomonas atlantica]|nr:S9 family peptidase [Hyphomonas atlantica]HBH44031.1 S9 family peptidase [Hyphomonas atlantica]